MLQISGQIYAKISSERIIPMKQIQDFAWEQYEITPRHTIRIIQGLEKAGWIKKYRITGKRKRKGYVINEDNIGTLSEMWFNFPKNKYIKKATQEFWTQDMISQYIDLWVRRYHDSKEIKQSDSKKLKKMKEEWKENFAWVQLHDMFQCVQLITNIEWVLRTGILGSGKGKRNLAERNITKLEKHLEEMSKDLKEHDEQIWKQILGSVYNTLENTRGLEYNQNSKMNQESMSLTKTNK